MTYLPSLELNRQLETYDDFNDEAVSLEKGSNSYTSLFGSTKLSHLVTAKPNKPKVWVIKLDLTSLSKVMDLKFVTNSVADYMQS